ncbi:MAG: hypothetical protein HY925_10720 [Elusimicrobia bacterium]|nr:hypothetical protein [Elusimicrobiota bacterium]
MRPPLFAIAAVAAALGLAHAAEPVVSRPLPARMAPETLPANQIPKETGPTAEMVGGLADDPTQEGQSRIYDGAGLTAGSSAFTLKNPIGPKVGAGKPAARPRAPEVPQKTVAAKKEPDAPFWDDKTVGFAALGVLAGGLIGLGAAFMGMGPAGVVLGAVLGAALLVGLFKWKGYTKGDKKGE